MCYYTTARSTHPKWNATTATKAPKWNIFFFWSHQWAAVQIYLDKYQVKNKALSRSLIIILDFLWHLIRVLNLIALQLRVFEIVVLTKPYQKERIIKIKKISKTHICAINHNNGEISQKKQVFEIFLYFWPIQMQTSKQRLQLQKLWIEHSYT